jgi:hypothetical protein
VTDAQALPSRRAHRLAPLASSVAAVVLVHAWLLLGWSVRGGDGHGGPQLHLRQIVLAAPTAPDPAVGPAGAGAMPAARSAGADDARTDAVAGGGVTTSPPRGDGSTSPQGGDGATSPPGSRAVALARAAAPDAGPPGFGPATPPATPPATSPTTRPADPVGGAARAAASPAADPISDGLADADDLARPGPGGGSSAGAGDAAEVAAALATPALPTDLPPAWRLHYELERGARSGHAVLHWQRDAGGYRLEMSGRIDGAEALGWASRGGFDAAGIAPERFVVRRRGRDAASVNFRRDAAPAITFSGPSTVLPLPTGTQDRATWLVQLVGIVRALPQPVAAGMQVALPVAGPRGDLAPWRFGAGPLEPGAAADAPAPALQRWHRPALRPRDLDVQVWLDPARGQLPVRIRIEAQPHGGVTEWRLRAAVPGA